jgi:acyl-CoA synthetase (AMP-forming)/AMP-acid ligase II
LSSLTEILSPDYASKTAVIIPDGGPTLTYAKLRERVASLAEALRQGGVRPADPVSIVLPNGLEFVTTFLAVTWVRAVAAPLNPAYKSEELRFFMENCGARAVIVPPGKHPARDAAVKLNLPAWEARLDAQGRIQLAQPAVTPASTGDSDVPRPDDVALFLHTSGTTSHPKGVLLTHSNLMTSLHNIVHTYQLTPEDVSLIVMPLFHVHGLLGATLSTLNAGGTVVIPRHFSASRFWQQVLEYGVNWYSAVPTIHQILLTRADKDLAPSGKLRFIRSCSAALAPAVLSQLEDRFDVPVLEAYGMTETSHQISSNPLPPGVRKPGTVGAGTGVEITIMDEQGNMLPNGVRGEVAIRGCNVMNGYYNNPAANAAAFTKGWFRTGDQGFLDADNYLTLTGRIKELINRGGEKISPLEVDAVLLEHPAIAEAVCFGVPDELYGEEVHATVVLKGDVSEKALIAFCRDHLADFKTPKKVYIADALPQTATGKIQRRVVAAYFREQ